MKNDFQISEDGTVFQIKEDGTITKLGKIEDGRIVTPNYNKHDAEEEPSNRGLLLLFLAIFAIATLVLGILYSEVNNKYKDAVRRENALERRISILEFDLNMTRIPSSLPSYSIPDTQDYEDPYNPSTTNRNSVLRSELEYADIEELREAYSERGGNDRRVMASRELLIQALEIMLE